MSLSSGINLDNLVLLKTLLLRFESYLDKEVPSKGGSYAGEYIFHIMKEGLNVSHSTHVQLINMIRKVSDFILDVRGGAGSGSGGRTSGATPKLDHLVSSIKKVFGSAGTTQMQAMARAGGYRVNITPSSSGPSGSGRAPRTLSYWCLTPSLSLIDLKALNVRSILVTSGTLSPLPSYALELGLPFPNRLENPHIISEKQIHVQIVSKGISGKQLCSNYGRRDDPEYHTELGNTLATLARLVPDGMLVFFPSYSVMHACIAGFGGPRRGGGSYGADRSGTSSSSGSGGGGGSGSGFFAPRRKFGGSKSASAANSDRFSFPHSPDYYGAMGGSNKTPWSRLLATKSIVLEPRSSSNLPAAIAEFKKYLSKPKSTGAILMGVCRGKISEGIDFADNMCRAVVITGLPFPPFKDDKVRLKREYLDSAKARSKVVRNDDAGFDASPSDISSEGIGKGRAWNQQEQQEHLSGAAWYDQQAHRAVNQAVGRTIRHRNDYGAILLLDSRFADARNRKGLSKWVRPYIQEDQGMGKNVGSLGRFFKAAQEMKERERVEATGKSGAIQLEYEEERAMKGFGANQDDKEEEDEITRIAVVQAKASVSSERDCGNGKSGPDDDLTRGFVRPDLVLKRVDMKDCRSATKDDDLDELMEDGGPSNDFLDEETSSGLESLYSTSRGSKRPSRQFPSDHNAAAAASATSTSIGSTNQRNASSEGGAFGSLKPAEQPRNPYQTSKARALAFSTDSNHKTGLKRKHPMTDDNTKLHVDSSSGQRARPNSSSSRGSTSSANGAKKFFDAARKALSVDDFNTVRGALVRMKQHGDKEDERSYLEAAEDLVQVLSRYDDELLVLFYPLLPSKLAPAVMKIAATVTFNTSRFQKIAKDELSQEEFMMASTSVVSLLTNAQRKREDVRTFIRELDPILSLLIKHSASSSSRSLIPAFLTMVPLRYRQSVRARVEQMERAEEKDKLKEIERRHVGEASIKLENFRRPTNFSTGEILSDAKQQQQQQKVKKESASNPEQLEAQREMEGGLMAAQQVRIAARERLAQKIKAQASVSAHGANIRQSKSSVGSTSAKAAPKNPYVVRNPYASRPSSSASTGSTSKSSSIGAGAPRANLPASGSGSAGTSTGTASSSASTFGSTRHVSKRARGMVQQKKKQGNAEADTTVEAMDALDQCLHQVKTDVFTGNKRKSKSFPKFKQTNVPEGLDCQICSEMMKDPLVSDCNHSACASCWTQWLRKNASCPACRTTMTRKNLSRIVFRKDDDDDAAKLPTHSQVIRDAVAESDDEEDTGDSSDDGEEELELVAG